MKLPELDTIRRRLESLDDSSLLEMVTVEAADYRDDVLDAARNELRRRGREVPTTDEFLESLSPDELEEGHHFCKSCHEETTDERFPASGVTFRRQLTGAYDRCNVCGSVVRDHCLVVFFIPIWRFARYRVKEMRSPGTPWPAPPKIIASRRMRDSEPAERPRKVKRRKRRKPRRPGDRGSS